MLMCFKKCESHDQNELTTTFHIFEDDDVTHYYTSQIQR